MATSQTSAGFAGRPAPGPVPALAPALAPVTSSARAVSRLSASRSPVMLWCTAARPSVSVTPGTAGNTCPAVSSSKYGPSAFICPPRAGGHWEARGDLVGDGRMPSECSVHGDVFLQLRGQGGAVIGVGDGEHALIPNRNRCTAQAGRAVLGDDEAGPRRRLSHHATGRPRGRPAGP